MCWSLRTCGVSDHWLRRPERRADYSMTYIHAHTPMPAAVAPIPCPLRLGYDANTTFCENTSDLAVQTHSSVGGQDGTETTFDVNWISD